jgi:chitosanase
MGEKLAYYAIMLLTFVFLVTPCLADTKSAAIQMTTTFENWDTQLHYNYAENIGDGRGITFGCIGFCTGTGDGLVLVQYYTSINPNNPLAKYLPALEAIDEGPHNYAMGEGNPSTKGLDGFIEAVQNNNDPLFIQAQLHELDRKCWNPAVENFNKIGAKYPFTQALLYDITVRYGDDHTQLYIQKAKSKCGGTPATGIDEISFDKAVMNEYSSLLKSEKLGDVDRIDSFMAVLNSGNYNLVTPFSFEAYGKKFTITGELEGVSSASDTTVKPNASFSTSRTSGYIPLKVQFKDQSTGNPTGWKWDFGDGYKSTAKNPSHTFKKAGKWKVTLKVSNTVGSGSSYYYITAKKSSKA